MKSSWARSTGSGPKRWLRWGHSPRRTDPSAAAINPTAGRTEQLRAIREIFPPEKEALGVLAIEIEKA